MPMPRARLRKIEALGVTKARSDTLSLLVLAVLAGAFIARSPLFTVVMTRSPLSSASAVWWGPRL